MSCLAVGEGRALRPSMSCVCSRDASLQRRRTRRARTRMGTVEQPWRDRKGERGRDTQSAEEGAPKRTARSLGIGIMAELPFAAKARVA
eukprot:4153312-Pleurochrysis_carterae.AAC.1